jgi:hypothetical protein
MVYGGGWVNGTLPFVCVDWIGTEYSGDGWLKAEDCLIKDAILLAI